MLKAIVRVSVVIGLISLFSGCSEQSDIRPVTDRTQLPISITVHLYQNRSELNAAWAQSGGVADDQRRLGFAQWNQLASEGVSGPRPAELRCDIHAIQPVRVQSDAVTTLGHELLHCVYGAYHAE
jgi:hypothetical protein